MRVFFSFDFAEDLWRASIVRNRWITDPAMAGGVFWEPAFARGAPPKDPELQQIVEGEVRSADVIVVLIGERTARCEHVRYAIRRAAELGRGLTGIYIDNVPDRYGTLGRRGANPFDAVPVPDGDGEMLSRHVRVHEWTDVAFERLAGWILDAARDRAT